MSALLALGLVSALSASTIHLPVAHDPGQQLALHCVTPAQANGQSVLFVHGASFPTMLAFGFEFAPGDSWMDFMARQGFLACGLDFVGFGGSSRPAAMAHAAADAAPVTRAAEAAREIAVAIDYLRKTRGMGRVHLVAHSWGTVPAATFAAKHSGALASLTLFGPVVPKAGDPPGELRIPAGPAADIDAVASGGSYPYDPAAVRVPVFVVYGDYDTVTDDAGATAFLAKFSASPLTWRMRIDHGSHVMHLERNRHSLYRSVDAFIHAAQDMQP